MIHLRNKFLLAFAFLVASIFLSISLGGEFFHHKIHHHQTTVSHDECPLHQLLVQAFLLAVALGWGLQLIKSWSNVLSNVALVFPPQYLLPSLRAPPVSL